MGTSGNKSMFGQLFTELMERIDCLGDEKLSAIKKDFESFDLLEANVRNGMQSKIAVFFDAVRNRIKQLSHAVPTEKSPNINQNFISKVFEAISLYYYQSVKKNRGINYPNVGSLENLMGSFTCNIPKANENFTSFMVQDKKLLLKTISELSAFIATMAVLFDCDIIRFEEEVVNLLRSHVKIFLNNKDFVAEVNKQICNFKIMVDQTVFDATQTMQMAEQHLNFTKSAVLLGKLIFVLLYFTDYKSPTQEAKTEYITWINNIQDYFVKVCNGYIKYLWIRYRRLPGFDMSLDLLNGLTIDNVYVFPNFSDDKNSVENLLSSCFNKNEQKRTRKAIVAGHGMGKTSLLHLIISCIVINSNYAVKDENISRYFMKYYNIFNKKLCFNSSDVFPIIINCEKFGSYAKNKQRDQLSLTNFAYYIIKQYDEDLNVVGERNKGWYDKWIVTFSSDEFMKILNGAIEDDKLMLLVDSVDNIEDNYKIMFEEMLNNFIHTYGCSCEMIFTSSSKEFLPQSIIDEKYGFDIVKIDDFNTEQIKKILLNYYTFFKSADEVVLKKQAIITEMETDEDKILMTEVERKLKDYESLFKANEKFVNKLYSDLEKNPQTCAVLKNPYMLTKIAKLCIKSDFDFNSLLNDLLFDSLSVMNEISETVNDVIQKEFFKVAIDCQLFGNYDNVYKLYKKLDGNNLSNADAKTKNLVKTTKNLLKLLLENKTND